VEESNIHFFSEAIDFQLENKASITKWLYQIAQEYHFEIEEINYIFCNDTYLLEINQEYLQHNTYTDIITFDNSEKPQKIISDIFISIERVRENAKKFNTTFENESLRVIIHGLLHLVGFKDKEVLEKELMTRAENESLDIYQSFFSKV